jgi:Diacylglycerol kinase catalytic domain
MPLKLEERRLLVFVNPKSGTGKAKEIFERRVVPLLVDAELPYDLHLTQGPNYARRYVRQRPDLASVYSDIVIVSGDGLMFEVCSDNLYQYTLKLRSKILLLYDTTWEQQQNCLHACKINMLWVIPS